MVAAAPVAGWLAGAIGDAARLAGTLWDAARAAAAVQQADLRRLDERAFAETPGGRALLAYGSRAAGGNAAQERLRDRAAAPADQARGYLFAADVPPPPPARGGGGGGGGGTAAVDREADALARLVAEQRRQVALLRETDPVQREIMQNHEALATATDAELAEVVRLISERMRLEEIRDRIDEIGAAGRDAFTGLVTGAHSFRDALAMVLDKLAEMAASSAWDLIWAGLRARAGLAGWWRRSSAGWAAEAVPRPGRPTAG